VPCFFLCDPGDAPFCSDDRFSSVAAENSNVAFSVSAPTLSGGSKASPPTDTSLGDGSEEPADNSGENSGSDESQVEYHSPKDPLRWFGILVPPALRQAQSSFVAAVDGPIPEIATLTKDLRRQEVDIARVRKQIKKL
jgi:coiled-coil domain-containing protein 115